MKVSSIPDGSNSVNLNHNNYRNSNGSNYTFNIHSFYDNRLSHCEKPRIASQ